MTSRMNPPPSGPIIWPNMAPAIPPPPSGSSIWPTDPAFHQRQFSPWGNPPRATLADLQSIKISYTFPRLRHHRTSARNLSAEVRPIASRVAECELVHPRPERIGVAYTGDSNLAEEFEKEEAVQKVVDAVALSQALDELEEAEADFEDLPILNPFKFDETTRPELEAFRIQRCTTPEPTPPPPPGLQRACDYYADNGQSNNGLYGLEENFMFMNPWAGPEVYYVQRAPPGLVAPPPGLGINYNGWTGCCTTER